MKSHVPLVQAKDITHCIKPTKEENKGCLKTFFFKCFDCLLKYISQPMIIKSQGIHVPRDHRKVKVLVKNV